MARLIAATSWVSAQQANATVQMDGLTAICQDKAVKLQEQTKSAHPSSRALYVMAAVANAVYAKFRTEVQ